jgi:hypothetical protein
MEQPIPVTGKTIKLMGTESFIMLVVTSMRAIGNKTKPTVLASSLI